MLLLIWGEGSFPHKPIFLSRFIWKLLTAGFGAGALLVFCTQSDQFICHQSVVAYHTNHITFKIFIYGRQTLSVVFLPTTYISIYLSLFHQAYKIFFNQFYKNTEIYSILYVNQHVEVIICYHCNWTSLKISKNYGSTFLQQ